MNTPPPSLIDEFFKKIIGPLAATDINLLLDEPELLEERVHHLAQVFRKYPKLIHPFQAMIKSLHAQEPDVSLEEQIRFFTTHQTREWLLISLLHQVLDQKELKLDSETGKLPGKPEELIQYAIKARAAFGEDGRYKDLAFAAGLIFDFFHYAQKLPLLELGDVKFDDAISEAFTTAVEQGKLTIKLSHFKSQLSLEKFTPITPFLRQIAQISFLFLLPNKAPEFYKKLATLEHTESVRLALELEAFGAHTGMLAAYLAQAMPVFKELGEAMSIWGFPYLSWMSGKRDIHDLAGMGLLGVILSEKMSAATLPEGQLIGETIPELHYLDLKPDAQFKATIKKA